jgi:hypothetical protein
MQVVTKDNGTVHNAWVRSLPRTGVIRTFGVSVSHETGCATFAVQGTFKLTELIPYLKQVAPHVAYLDGKITNATIPCQVEMVETTIYYDGKNEHNVAPAAIILFHVFPWLIYQNKSNEHNGIVWLHYERI